MKPWWYKHLWLVSMQLAKFIIIFPSGVCLQTAHSHYLCPNISWNGLKSACCFTDYWFLFVLGLHEQITSNKIWLVKFQLRGSSTGPYEKQTIIIVLSVYLDQEVQKSLIERRSAMSGYPGSKISELSQQSFVKETAICICKQQKENMGFCFVPECNHAQESHTCQFFPLRYKNFATMATWRNDFSTPLLCPQQADLQPFPFHH